MDLTAKHLDTLSNSELASHMGWSDANARGPGVDAEASIAVGLLREGLPEAIEKGIVRVVDGPEYNIPTSTLNNPNMGPSPALSIMWHAMASTTSFKAYDTSSYYWMVCKKTQSNVLRVGAGVAHTRVRGGAFAPSAARMGRLRHL